MKNLPSRGRQLWIIFWSLLIVCVHHRRCFKSPDSLWTRSAAGRDHASSYGRAIRSPAHGKVLSSFLLFIDSWNSVLGQYQLLTGSVTWIRVSRTSPSCRIGCSCCNRGLGSLADGELECACFTLFLSHLPGDATCDVTGCSPPS